MLGLRIIGFVVGAYWLLTTVLQFLKGRRSPVDLILFGVCAVGLIFLSVDPNLLDRLLIPLAFKAGNYGRLVGILLFGFAFLFFLHLRQTDNLKEVDSELTRLIQRMGMEKFSHDYPENLKGPVAILIPAFNEGGVIGSVLEKIPKSVGGLACEVLVIDDGSQDDTVQVAKSFGAKVASHAMNRGGGAALGTGYQLVRQSEIPFMVTIDADGQYLPEEIPALAEPMIRGDFDFVVGSRLRGHYEGLKDFRLIVRTVGLYFFNLAASVLLCRVVTDIPSGFRAIRSSYLKSMKLTQKQFHTSEFLIEALRSGVRFKEIPISFMKRRVGESKKPASLRYGWGFFKALFGTWWR